MLSWKSLKRVSYLEVSCVKLFIWLYIKLYHSIIEWNIFFIRFLFLAPAKLVSSSTVYEPGSCNLPNLVSITRSERGSRPPILMVKVGDREISCRKYSTHRGSNITTFEGEFEIYSRLLTKSTSIDFKFSASHTCQFNTQGPFSFSPQNGSLPHKSISSTQNLSRT